MDGADLFSKCLAQATVVVKQVRPQHWGSPTPDSEWNVRDLLAHMLYELSWVPDLVAGKTIEEVGDVYDTELSEDSGVDITIDWQTAADKADAAVAEADPDEPAHLSYGEVTNDYYLQQQATDQLIHAWDLGKAIGVPVRFDTEAAQVIYDFIKPQQAELVQTGLFAAALPVPDSADLQTKLLGLLGRDAGWQPA